MAPRSFEQDRLNLRAKKFMMWLFLASSFIYFAGLTSGFIVYTAGDPSRGIKTILPKIFQFSTLTIIISSITMHMAYVAGKRLQYSKQRLYLAITILLGVIFFVLQVKAWGTLFNQGIPFVNPNASQSFIYVFTGSHLIHIFAGVMMLLNTLIRNLRNTPQVQNIFRLEITSIFWHFLDILWIYLYVFLLLNQ
jgi:cytochrome c oxidase subunit 3